MAEEQKQHQRPQPQPVAQKPNFGEAKMGPSRKAEIGESADFKYILRIANTDLDGKKPLLMGLQKIKGVSFMMANAYCSVLGLDKVKKVGDLSDAETEKLNTIIKNHKPSEIPSWMFNRKKDMETGEDLHIVGADLTFTHENDIRQLKKIKCYRGVRHIMGQPVRGQRTRSNFRKNKGKVTSVKRSVVAKAAAVERTKEKEKESKDKGKK